MSDDEPPRRRDASTESTSAESDPPSSRSRLADLAAEITRRRTEDDPASTDSEADTATDENPVLAPVTERIHEMHFEESLERVRHLVSDRLHQGAPSRPSRRRTGTRGKRRRVYALIAIGAAVFIVLSAVVGWAGHVEDTLIGPAPASYVDDDDTLYLTASDAAYLSRIYRETNHEVAYCGLITRDRGHPDLEIWMADTVRAGPDMIEFLTTNCPAQSREVLMHTHPSGSLRLSTVDERTLQHTQEQFMCVQGGELTTVPGSTVDNLACYRQVTPVGADVEYRRIPVRIAERGDGV